MTNYAGFEAQLYYKQESVKGTTPSGQWNAVAQKASCHYMDSPSPNFVHKSGSVDSAKPTKGISGPTLQAKFNPNLGNGKAFLKSFVSSDTSFSLLIVKIDISNTVFQRLTGCMTKRTQASGQLWPAGKPVDVDMEIWAFDTVNFDEGPSPSYESFPDSILNWSDVTIKTVADPSGTNPPRSTITQWNKFDWTIENDLYRIPDNNGHTTDIKRGERKGTGSFEFITTGNASTEISATQSAQYQDIEFLFGADSYLFNYCAYTDLDLGYDAASMALKMIKFEMAQLVIT